LKIRRDAVGVSCILYTIALLIPMPAALGNAWTVPQRYLEITDYLTVQNYFAPIGFASLAVIMAGLIVTWAGYIRGVRWAWFVLFVITWVWAFPVLVLAEFHWRNMLPIAEWHPLAQTSRGLWAGFAESVLPWLLMVLALVIPVKTFFRGGDAIGTSSK
jgi:hypothetical protein